MEATELRRPVISNFVAGETGWLVPAGDEHALAAAMREVLTPDPARLAAMGDPAYSHVFERHSIETEAAKLESFMLGRVA